MKASVSKTMCKLLVAAALFVSEAAGAQRAPSLPDADTVPFEGFYAGPEFGAIDHHFYLNVTDNQGRVLSDRYYRTWDVGGGAFAGYDAAISPRIRLGGEVSVVVGGDNPVARFPDGRQFTQKPRYGLKGTVRAGYLATPLLLIYGLGGYGGDRRKLSGTLIPDKANEWGSSFVIGAGVEYRVSPKIGLRLDFKHLDNDMSQIFVGIPVRF
ncbi:MAG TPA: outer membrane beta-barrel protein [Sphingomicrobium sp.]